MAGDWKMEQALRTFLERYIGRGTQKNDIVTQEAVDLLIITAKVQHLEQKIMDYGNENPDAPFWDFMNFIEPGLHGVTQEELLGDDEED